MDRFENGLPVMNEGMICDQFVSGRMAAGIAPHGGLTYISYVGRQSHEQSTLFSATQEAAFSKLLRLQPIIDDAPYYFEPGNTHYYPFGCTSECTLADVRLRYELVLDQDALMQRIVVLENPLGRSVRARVLQHGHLSADYNGQHIEWTILPDGTLEGSRADGLVQVNVICDQACHSIGRHGTFKLYMESENPSDAVIFALICDRPQHELPDIASGLSARMDAAFARYDSYLQSGLRITTGDEVFDSAMNNVLPTLDTLAVKDTPGAVRASQTYWVWGWDSMVHAEAYLWSGQTDIVRDMLDFYREHASPERGIGHAYTTDFQPIVFMRTCAQGLYIVLLHNYFAATGDRETVLRNLPFAYHVLELAAAEKHPECHLGRGKGYIPDEPGDLQQKRGDIATVNNSLYLQALRCIAALEESLDLPEAARHTQEADLMQADMEQYLWDENCHYWVESLDGETLERRPYYPVYAHMFASPYALWPHRAEASKMAEFMKQRFLFPEGVYNLGPMDPGFMADGNQIGAYYPVNDRYYWNIMNLAEDTMSASDFQRIVKRFWQEHSYPEGITHETVNADPTSDNPGCKQAFAMKSWLCDAIQLNLGLQVYADGFTCHPLNTGCAFKVENIRLRGYCLCLERTLNGTVLLNGSVIPHRKITWDELAMF